MAADVEAATRNYDVEDNDGAAGLGEISDNDADLFGDDDDDDDETNQHDEYDLGFPLLVHI